MTREKNPAARRAQDIAAAIRQEARNVFRIHDPMRSNPERVFEQKDEIAKALEAIAREVEARHG